MEQVPTVIHDLLRLKVEVILAAGLDVAVATRRITVTLPIVVVDATYEGRDRIVESLSRPGGNVTGLGEAGPTLSEKRLALIKETLPRASQVTILSAPFGSWSNSDAEVRAMDTAAARLRLRLSWVEVKSLDHVTTALQAVARRRPDVLLIMGHSTMFARRHEIAAFTVQHRLPAMGGYRELVDEGALMSYRDPLPERFRRAATYVDKILKGANPATLPIELPTRFELAINLKTAKTLGLTIPSSILLQADSIVQ